MSAALSEELVGVERAIPMRRVWAMPDSDTFNVPPIGGIVRWHLSRSKVSIDPFARNKRWATYTNDLNPETAAEYHMEALEFLVMLQRRGIQADLVIFDPPYSARQVAECYAQVGRVTTMQDTQGKSWSDWKAAIAPLCVPDALVISCGWNTNGMGLKHGFAIEEIMLVAHGGVHNDTIVIVERKTEGAQNSLFGAPKLSLAVTV